jgi:Protein of unknown function (DUF3293)
MTDRQLAEKYAGTSYIIEAPGGDVAIHVGRPSAVLDALLESLGAVDWAFITAWNPGSMRLPPAENERNNNDLLERIGRLGYEAIPGEGVGDDGDWPAERSFFVAGIPAGEAMALGRYYRQRAIVVGRRGGAPVLAWC